MKEYSIFGIKPDVYREMNRDESNKLKKLLPEDPKEFIKNTKLRLIESGLLTLDEREYIMSKEIAEKHYEEHIGTPKFDGLIDFMISGNTYWIIFCGEDAIKKGREILTEIRTEYLINPKARYNMTHAADSIESAKYEITLHFPEFKKTF